MIANVGFVAIISFIIKIFIHSYLLHKIGKFKLTSAENPSRLQFAFRIWFDVPPDLRFLKFIGNLFYGISILCLSFFLAGQFYKR